MERFWGMLAGCGEIPAYWREGRRKRAWELKEQGWRQKDIVRALGVNRTLHVLCSMISLV